MWLEFEDLFVKHYVPGGKKVQTYFIQQHCENISLIVQVWNDGYIEEHEHRF